MSKELITAVKAAKKAGSMLKHQWSCQSCSFKNRRQIVTKYDLQAEKIILSTIKKNFPKHSFYGEEGGKTGKSEYQWVIDPIDGTSNFTAGIPIFATSIALVKNQETIVAVVYNPITKELFTAQKGRGAFLNSKKIHVSKANQLAKSLISLNRGANANGVTALSKLATPLDKNARTFRKLGCCSLEFCYVACGKLDGLVNLFSYPYDYAAGALIIREAGGTATDLQGKPFTLFTKCVIAANKKIHAQLLRVVSRTKLP
ncbi:MAG: inositol monophosphatase family protein [Candidatus Woesearchaeota archaeon]